MTSQFQGSVNPDALPKITPEELLTKVTGALQTAEEEGRLTREDIAPLLGMGKKPTRAEKRKTKELYGEGKGRTLPLIGPEDVEGPPPRLSTESGLSQQEGTPEETPGSLTHEHSELEGQLEQEVPADVQSVATSLPGPSQQGSQLVQVPRSEFDSLVNLVRRQGEEIADLLRWKASVIRDGKQPVVATSSKVVRATRPSPLSQPTTTLLAPSVGGSSQIGGGQVDLMDVILEVLASYPTRPFVRATREGVLQLISMRAGVNLPDPIPREVEWDASALYKLFT